MNLITSALFALAGAAIAAAAAQTYRLARTQDALADLQQSIATAAQTSELRGATTAVEAVSQSVETQQKDAPVVERVVTRTVNVCLRQQAADRLPVPGAAGGARQADAETKDDANRAAWLGAVADDLATCAAALNRCDSIRNFHNANVGTSR